MVVGLLGQYRYVSNPEDRKIKWSCSDVGLRRCLKWTNMVNSVCQRCHGGGCKESCWSYTSSAGEECGRESWSTELQAYRNFWTEANHSLDATQVPWAPVR